MSQADPPWQGERETGSSGSLQPWKPGMSCGQSTHFGPVGLRQAELLSATSHPNQDDAEIWGPAPAKEVLDFGSNPQPARFFCRYGWPPPALW